MNYSPEMREAMKEILAIVDKYDLAAHIIIHKPGADGGFTEYKMKLDPSFSCAKLTKDPVTGTLTGVYIDNNIDHCGGDKKLWLNRGHDTIQMFQHIAHVGKMHMDWLSTVTEHLEATWKYQKVNGTHSERKDD